MSGEARVLRKRKTVDATSWVHIVGIGFARFAASVGDDNDGMQGCGATILYNDSGAWRPYVGATGRDHGHAEMHALFQFVAHVCKFKVDKFDAILASVTVEIDKNKVNCGIRVECTAKPCCLYCSAMLGLLGIRPWDANTKKSVSRMGGTQWGIPESLRQFISDKAGYSMAELAKIDSHAL
jgi:hypothetical protein